MFLIHFVYFYIDVHWQHKDRFDCSQGMDGVLNTDLWSASHVEAELSAGEVLRTAFDEQIKRRAGTLAFSLPRSSLWIRRGLFRLRLFVCLFSFFDKQTSSFPAPSVWWGNERTGRVRWSEEGEEREHYSLKYFCHYVLLFVCVLSLSGRINQPFPRPRFSRRIWRRDCSHNLSASPVACHPSARESTNLSPLSDMSENFWTLRRSGLSPQGDKLSTLWLGVSSTFAV